MAEAEADYLLARTLFPENRRLYMAQVGASVHGLTSVGASTVGQPAPARNRVRRITTAFGT